MHNLKYLIICVLLGACSDLERPAIESVEWLDHIREANTNTLCVPEIVLCEETLR